MTRRAGEPAIDRWLSQMTPGQQAQAEALPLRRDMLTLLTYLRDNKVTTTQVAAHLPLKAVREITARFVDPPVLERQSGGTVTPLRSEKDIWPLYFLHILADGNGLISGSPARRLRLTTAGEKFLMAIPPVQVWSMLSTWWQRVNWLVAFPVIGMGDRPPRGFQAAAMHALLALPVDQPVSFDRFASGLMKTTGYRWSKSDLAQAEYLMHSGIRRIVIDILADFECVQTTCREEPLGAGTIQQLDAFTVTPFGRGLLQAVAEVWQM